MNPSDSTTTAVETAVRQAVDAAAPSGGQIGRAHV